MFIKTLLIGHFQAHPSDESEKGDVLKQLNNLCLNWPVLPKNASSHKTQQTLSLEEPCSPAQAGQGTFDCKEFKSILYSLANPVPLKRDYGECARCCSSTKNADSFRNGLKATWVRTSRSVLQFRPPSVAPSLYFLPMFFTEIIGEDIVEPVIRYWVIE